MLDDCRGEKFDELLAVFSTAVLRKLVAVSADEMLWNPSMRLSTATSISPTDYQNLLPLILAHQVSLSAAGARRARVHETYDRFSQLLDDKKIELAERADKESENDLDQEHIDPEGLASELKANWLGNEEWATTLLDGGSQSSTDAFLEQPFSQAWARATASTVDDLGHGMKPDLVIDLEARVLRLRSRLRRWHDFNDSLRKERGGDANATATKSQGPRLVFREHQSLTVASISKAVRQPGDRGRVLKEADRSFISTVNEAVARINGKSRVNAGQALPAEATVDTKPLASETWVRDHQSTLPSAAQDTGTEASVLSEQPDSPATYLDHQPEEANSHPSPPVVRLSPDQPSPAESEPDPEPLKPTTAPNYTLVERTRKSISLLPPLPPHEQPRPRQRRGPRSSFPVNQFVTPRKSSRPSGGRSGASTPQDKLFEEDADYASVFKSRPRVAQSPISSPAVHVSPSLDEEDFELNYDEEDVEWGDTDSPLAVSRVRG